MILVVIILIAITLRARNLFIETFLNGDIFFFLVVENNLDEKINFDIFFLFRTVSSRKYAMEIIFTSEEILIDIKINTELNLNKQLFNLI